MRSILAALILLLTLEANTFAESNPSPKKSTCTGPLADPRIQTYARKVVAQMQTDQFIWSLSLDSIVERFVRSFDALDASRVYWPYRDPIDEDTYNRVRQAMEKAGRDTWRACFPDFMVLLDEVAKRKAAVEDEVARRKAAEAKAREEAAAEAKKPVNRLRLAYKRYAYVKLCNEVRQGYLVVYINDIELDRARTAVKAVENHAVDEDKSLDTDALWKAANKELKGELVGRDTCQATFNDLLQQSASVRPEDNVMPKDF